MKAGHKGAAESGEGKTERGGGLGVAGRAAVPESTLFPSRLAGRPGPIRLSVPIRHSACARLARVCPAPPRPMHPRSANPSSQSCFRGGPGYTSSAPFLSGLQAPPGP